MKARLVRHIKVREDDGGIIEVKVWEVGPAQDKPHGYKYSLAYIVNGERVIGYDNAEGKGDHRHYRDKTERYSFKSLKKLADDFYGDIAQYREDKVNEGKKS